MLSHEHRCLICGAQLLSALLKPLDMGAPYEDNEFCSDKCHEFYICIEKYVKHTANEWVENVKNV